jgi:adenosylcobinamide-GDP ribazoletransferase
MPLVGALIGGVLALADAAMHVWGLPPLLESVVVVVMLLAITGGLHADGLMDTCDAAFGHATPERRLEIMRDPRVGAFGVMGLVSIVSLKISAVDGLMSPWRPGYLVLAPTMGRWAIILMAAVFPYGRSTGLGAPLKAAATPRALALASLLPVVVCVANGTGGIVTGLMAAACAYLLGRWLLRLLPGLTGDCYGAVCEFTETVVWLSGAALVPRL